MLLGGRTGVGGGGGGGPALLSSLKVRVARLEAALRDKEAELARLQASTRVTTVNELRIQAHTYYQEVVRLRNQLNISQHATVPIIQSSGNHTATTANHNATTDHTGAEFQLVLTPTTKSNTQIPPSTTQTAENKLPRKTSSKIFHKRTQLTNKLPTMDMSKDEDDCTSLSHGEDELRKSMLLLHEENNKLREQVTALINTVQDSEQGGDSSSSTRGMLEKLLARLEARQAEANADSGTTYWRCRMTELQSKELEWERERASLRELITTLQEDRCFYKEAATKKENEMQSLRQEMLTLQQEMEGSSRAVAGARHGPRLAPRVPARTGSGSASSSESGTTTTSNCHHSRAASAARIAGTNRATSTARTAATQARANTIRTPCTARTPSTVRGSGTGRSLAPRPPLHASKASSEPRELPPRHNSTPLMARKAMTESMGVEGTPASKKQLQQATSARLANSIRCTNSSNSSTTSACKKTVRQVAPAPGVAKTGARATVGSSSKSSSSNSRSNTTSAASSKTNSQKATPVTSPTKIRSSTTSDSKTSATSYSSTKKMPQPRNSKPVSRSNKVTSSSSSSASNSCAPSKPNSVQNSPTKSTVSTPSKMPVDSPRAGYKKTPSAPATSSISDRSNSGNVQPPISVITEEDAHVLAELLRPEPHSSVDESSASSACVAGQDAIALHWDSSNTATDEEGWAAVRRARGVGAEQENTEESLEAVSAVSDVPADSDQDQRPESAAVTQAALRARTKPSPTHSLTDENKPPDQCSLAELLHCHLSRVLHLTILHTRHLDTITTSLDELKSLLCSHLHRQRQLDALLQREPQLLEDLSQQPVSGLRRPRALRSSGIRHRRSPDGAEGEAAVLDAKAVSPTKSLGSPVASQKSINASLTHPKSLGAPAYLTKSLEAPASPTKYLEGPVSPTKSIGSPTSKIPTSLKLGSPSTVHRSMSATPTTLTKLSSPCKKTISAPMSATSSTGLVRQGTFNLDQTEAFIDKSCQGDAGEGCALGDDGWQIQDEDDGGGALKATLSAHYARMRQLSDLKQ